jgi:3'-phosphoadenosine 5'-phosphosulfate sulfotransferase (PAPS reductase)/FAD synthetase
MNIETKETLVVSFSGGLTSGELSVILKTQYSHIYNLVFIFSNTGCENEETLAFVNECDKAYNLNVVWVEAVVNPIHGKGITHRVTNFENAYRNHQYADPKHPFHAHIRKSGIPNANKPQCSDRLKALAIEHYKKVHGLQGCKHAIGMRADEMNRAINKPVYNALKNVGLEPHAWRRIETSQQRLAALNEAVDKCLVAPVEKSLEKVYSYSQKLAQFNLVYPLIDWFPKTKQDINDAWEERDFTLDLEDHEGNCQTCWKKHKPKLYLLAAEHPERFEAFAYWEENYQHVKPNNDGQPRVFFRQHQSAKDILAKSKELPLAQLRMSVTKIKPKEDGSDGCSESCESYAI